MHVVAFDPCSLPLEMGVTLTTLEELVAQSDFISVHVPLATGTRNLGNGQALLEAVRNGRVAGAALDVRSHEPMPVIDPLHEEPRILLTPHIAGLTVGVGICTAITVVNDVVRVLSGQSRLLPSNSSCRRGVKTWNQ